jgi:TP901 family phage tail tape measure protein
MSMTKKVTKWTMVVDGDASGARRAMSSVGRSAGGLGSTIAKIGGVIAAAFAVKRIADFALAAGKMSMEFDDSMSKITSLVGVAKDEVAAMRPEVMKMATQFGKSGMEAADALFFITSAGLRGKDAMDVLAASLKASAIGLGETKTIADLATSALNAYGPATLSATAATDVLVASVREGKLEASSLSGAMGRVLPLASAMGVQFHEVGAAFAALSRTGTDANEAATQIRGIMAALLKPTTKAEKALKEMGLSSEKLRKQLKEKGLLSTLQTLKKEFGGNSAAAASVFGNVRALSGVLDLMGSNSATTVAIFESLAAAVGDTDKAFAVTADTAGFKYRKAIEGAKNAMIQLGDAVAPAIGKFSGWFGDTGLKAIQAFTDALFGKGQSQRDRGPAMRAEEMGKDIAPLQTSAFNLGEAVRDLAKAFGELFTALGDGSGPESGLARMLDMMTKLLTVVTDLMTKAQQVMKIFAGIDQRADAGSWRDKVARFGLQRVYGKDVFNMVAEMGGSKTGDRAIGGTVSGGSSYLVGERGPELFTPTSNGFVTANNRLGGGSTPINVTVNVQGSVVRERDLAVSIRDQMAQMMRRRGLDPAILGV